MDNAIRLYLAVQHCRGAPVLYEPIHSLELIENVMGWWFSLSQGIGEYASHYGLSGGMIVERIGTTYSPRRFWLEGRLLGPKDC